MGPWEDAQDFLNAPPARPGEQLGQPHAQRGVATVHVGYVRGTLWQIKGEKPVGTETQSHLTGLSDNPKLFDLSLKAKPQITPTSWLFKS